MTTHRDILLALCRDITLADHAGDARESAAQAVKLMGIDLSDVDDDQQVRARLDAHGAQSLWGLTPVVPGAA